MIVDSGQHLRVIGLKIKFSRRSPADSAGEWILGFAKKFEYQLKINASFI